jgi:hypothetical protein
MARHLILCVDNFDVAQRHKTFVSLHSASTDEANMRIHVRASAAPDQRSLCTIAGGGIVFNA